MAITATVNGLPVGRAMSATVTNGDFTVADTVQRNPVGTVVADYKGNEFIYLAGVASLAADDWVFYDQNYVAVRMVTSSINGPVAIAQGAPTAAQWGWFAIRHQLVRGNDIASDATGGQVFVSASAGSSDDDSGTGQTIYGAICRTVNSASQAAFQIDHPFVLGSAPA